MQSVSVPLDYMAHAAYFSAQENGRVDYEGPLDTPWIQEFRSKLRHEQIRDGVEDGEWKGDHVELTGRVTVDDWTVTYRLEYYPADDNDGYAFFTAE